MFREEGLDRLTCPGLILGDCGSICTGLDGFDKLLTLPKLLLRPLSTRLIVISLLFSSGRFTSSTTAPFSLVVVVDAYELARDCGLECESERRRLCDGRVCARECEKCGRERVGLREDVLDE